VELSVQPGLPLFASESKSCEYVPPLIAIWAFAPVIKNNPAAKKTANRRGNFIEKSFESNHRLRL
jgi:hypothetical protein